MRFSSAVTGTLDRAQTPIGSGYKLDGYREAAFTPELAVRTPVYSDLVADMTRKPPNEVKQAGRPRKGRKKRIPSVNEHATSSRYNAPACESRREGVDQATAPHLAHGGPAGHDPDMCSISRDGGASAT